MYVCREADGGPGRRAVLINIARYKQAVSSRITRPVAVRSGTVLLHGRFPRGYHTGICPFSDYRRWYIGEVVFESGIIWYS